MDPTAVLVDVIAAAGIIDILQPIVGRIGVQQDPVAVRIDGGPAVALQGDLVGRVEVGRILRVIAYPGRNGPAVAQRLAPVGFEGVGVDAPIVVKKAVIEVHRRVQAVNILDVTHVGRQLIALIGALFKQADGEPAQYIARLLGIDKHGFHGFVGVSQIPGAARVAYTGLNQGILVQHLGQAKGRGPVLPVAGQDSVAAFELDLAVGGGAVVGAQSGGRIVDIGRGIVIEYGVGVAVGVAQA